MKFLQPNLIRLDAEVQHAVDAIRAAGELLEAAGTADVSYTDAMVESYRDNGPYFVLAPGIALPHAKADSGVNEASVSFVRLKRAVAFGHKTNDPVDLVFALGSSASSDHIAMLRKLTLLLNDPDKVRALRAARSPEDVLALFADDPTI